MIPRDQGNLTLISGPMFSGKSDELIKLHNLFLEKNQFKEKEILIVKPSKDNRNNKIYSRTGKSLENVVSLEKSSDILIHLNKDIKVIFIDEFQFFDESLINIIKKLKQKNYKLVCAGLDKDFRKIDFPIYAKILNLVDFHILANAICYSCGAVAKFSQRLINNKPAFSKSLTIEVEFNNSLVSYKASCEKCHK